MPDPDHLRTLRERERYLAARVIAKQSVGWSYEHDERERAALEWAIARLAEMSGEGR